jgi:hypothetical protein
MGLLACLFMILCPLIAKGNGSEVQTASFKSFKQNEQSFTHMTSYHQWVVERMVSWTPPGRSFIKHAKETPEEGRARYEEIANALISVVFDPNEKPIFGGKYGRAKTLALLLSLSWFESGYRRDVDFGIGPLGVGDKGRSWCMMQVHLGRLDPISKKTPKRIILKGDYFKLVTSSMEGWGGKDLVSDRERCFRAGLHMVRRSFASCSRYHVLDRLGVYAGGECIREYQKSRVRVRKAQKWLATSKPPLTDKEIMKLMSSQGLPRVKVEKGLNVETL